MSPNATEFCRPRSSHKERVARLLLAAFVVTGIALLLVGEARADRRIFGFTYPYMTMPEGNLEIEHYIDAAFSETDDPSTTEIEDGLEPSWRHQLELEYAITDRLDLGFYNVFRQRAFEPLEYRGVKLRSRYRFGNPGDFFVDPAIYGEMFYFGDEFGFEQILILSRSLNDVEFALNLKFEEEFKADEIELVFNPTFGVGYHFNETFALAAEYFGELVVEDGEVEDMAHMIGPAVSIATGSFWWTVAVRFQVSALAQEPDFVARSIFAIRL